VARCYPQLLCWWMWQGRALKTELKRMQEQEREQRGEMERMRWEVEQVWQVW
jgi:hypothetical protein